MKKITNNFYINDPKSFPSANDLNKIFHIKNHIPIIYTTHSPCRSPTLQCSLRIKNTQSTSLSSTDSTASSATGLSLQFTRRPRSTPARSLRSKYSLNPIFAIAQMRLDSSVKPMLWHICVTRTLLRCMIFLGFGELLSRP